MRCFSSSQICVLKIWYLKILSSLVRNGHISSSGNVWPENFNEINAGWFLFRIWWNWETGYQSGKFISYFVGFLLFCQKIFWQLCHIGCLLGFAHNYSVDIFGASEIPQTLPWCKLTLPPWWNKLLVLWLRVPHCSILFAVFFTAITYVGGVSGKGCTVKCWSLCTYSWNTWLWYSPSGT